MNECQVERKKIQKNKLLLILMIKNNHKQKQMKPRKNKLLRLIIKENLPLHFYTEKCLTIISYIKDFLLKFKNVFLILNQFQF